MICVNELTVLSCNHRGVLQDLVVLLAPFAPHMAEELWQRLGHTTSVTHAPWPRWEAAHVQEASFEYPITVNGKVRTKLVFTLDTPHEEIEKQVLAHPYIQKWTGGNPPKKIIIVPHRIVNVVV